MMKEFWTLIDKFVNYLTPGHLESLLLYVSAMVIITIVHIWNRDQWVDGLKGDNHKWEGPEVLLYLMLWIFPSIIFANVFLQLAVPDMVWYTIWLLLLMAVFGKWGLQWILAFKTGQSKVESTVIKEKTHTETITKKESE